MNKDEVRVGQVFRDRDTRISSPFFTIKKLSKTHATGLRSTDFEGTKGYAGKDQATVKIRIDRLIKAGSRGYNLVKDVDQPQVEAPAPTSAPEASAPAPETPVEAPKTEAAAVFVTEENVHG